ncbi:tRNA (N6-threonylcarbamoyladenosine(37)-N6)-methyltransferase TrmO [Leeia aquatica]|nr:tRNA (N6-threonylcarbamoyladenosine(37)-N6)-methyltransferase TrmO [Leeia aquatica]
MHSPAALAMQPVAVVRSPFREKFGIPRQSGLTAGISSEVVLLPPYDIAQTVQGLEGFSHLWLLFAFHANLDRGWRPTVRPPRLGGNRRVGVFASRSTHRPNPIGLSVVALHQVRLEAGVVLQVSGADLLDGTPILDIKPYIPFADAIPDARGGYVDAPPQQSPITYSEAAQAQLLEHRQRWPELPNVIAAALGYDPRPAYHQAEGRRYGVALYDLDVAWEQHGQQKVVVSITRLVGE